MFNDTIVKQLAQIDSELKAQKARAVVNGGSLNMPENSPRASYSGRVGNTNNDVAARWVATFTRTDGLTGAPMVDFAWDFTLGVWEFQDGAAAGLWNSFNGPDRISRDQFKFSDAPQGTGANSTSWVIDISAAGMGMWYYYASNGAVVNLTVEAISPVSGTLTLSRVI